MAVEKTRRCSAPQHKGNRELPESQFQRDRSRASGFKSHCRVCRNYVKRLQYAENPAQDITRSRKNSARNTLNADSRDLVMLEEQEAAARKLLADREARLGSNFAPLKPDDFSSDFDTSIANRPDLTPAQRKQAVAEKRQEFSAAMSDHAHALRQATIAPQMLGAMPEDAGTYIGALAEQERRFGNRRLARSVSLFAAGEELARQLWIRACDQYLTERVVPTGFAKKPASAPAKRSVCLLLSDLHLGADLSGSDNPLPYRKIEEARRLEYILRQAIDYKPQYRKDSELVLMLNGDLIEGLLLHDFRDGAPLTEQKVIFLKYFERFVGECARAYPSVRVFCQPGNHGRDKLRHPGRATSSKWDGVETGLYYALSRACSGLKNVTWNIPFRAVCSIDLHGSWFLLSHGDTEIKLGDPDAKAKDNLAIIDKINATKIYGYEYAAAGFGHFHKPRYLPSKQRMIFNGALVPPNGHARTSGWFGESTGQFLFEATEGHPVGDVRFIEVGRAQDEDESLGRVIQPFRFDLEDVRGGLGT